MTVKFFLFPNKYRAECMPWGSDLISSSSTQLIRSRSRVMFSLITKILHLPIIQYVPVDIYVSDPPAEYPSHNVKYLWWNDETELSRQVGSKDFFACKLNGIRHNWLVIKPNLSKISRPSSQFLAKIIYFGEPSINYDSYLVSFASNMGTPDEMDRYIQNLEATEHTTQQDVHRFLGISALYKNFANCYIYGTGWRTHFPQALPSDYSTRRRRAAYRDNVCIDFGSKSGVSCLYPRSIEILLSSGVLFQKIQIDSYEIFGAEYCRHFTFDSYTQMLRKLAVIMEHPNALEWYYTVLQSTPLAKNCINVDKTHAILHEI